MSQKKPIWTSTEAHARLKEYCQASGRTQLEVVSELILTHLDLAQATQADTSKDSAQKADNRHFGGVWVV
jgi:hypothetical protein